MTAEAATRTCTVMTHPGSMHVDPEPPEYCENEAVEGSDYCTQHEAAEADADYWEDLIEQSHREEQRFEQA